MNATETTFKYILGALLLGATGSSLAVSLGRMQGATLVGRPFDVTLTAQFDSAEGLSAVCVAADVFFGDAQVPENRVRVVTGAGSKPGDARIRIQTTSAVDEPVVTVYVREGCSQKNARKYVILAEFLSDSASPVPVTMGEAVPPAAPAATQLPSTQDASSVAGALAGTKRAESATSGARKPSFKPKAVVSPAVASDERPAAATPPRVVLPSTHLTARMVVEPARKPSRARLKLDVLDLAAEREPVLRFSSELLSTPSTNALQRATAIALWQALNAQPQDILRDTQRLKSLETDVASMLAQSRKTEAAVMQLRVELEQARSERYSNWLVYALGALLMLASVLGIFLWTRSRRQTSEFSSGPWWRRGLDAQEGMEHPGSAPHDVEPMGQHLSSHLGWTASPAGAASDVDLDLDLDKFVRARPKISQAPQFAEHSELMSISGNTGFSSSLVGAPRVVNAEELSDVQHQADFFMSLGQFDKALDVLHHHITESEETSALVYLDLLDLYHHLNRKVDYELLRKDFNEIFNAEVSAFDQYNPESNGLEFYPSALSRIESLWPTPRVLDAIEESIFRKPGSNGDVFDIAAYRELLLLYAIAKEIVEQPADLGALAVSSSPSESGFSSTSSQPLSARLKDMPELSPLSKEDADLTQPTASRWLALDIDVSRDFDDSPAPQCVESGDLLEFDIDPSYLHGVKDK
jgi:hypothetical protein